MQLLDAGYLEGGIMTYEEAMDRFYLRKAMEAAVELSEDPKTQTGALLVVDGTVLRDANRFPEKVDKRRNRLDGGNKNIWVEHAERNVIYKAARSGISTQGTTLYSSWFTCVECARAIIQAGIFRLVLSGVVRDLERGQNWRRSQAIAEEMLCEAGIEILYLEGLVEGPRILFDGNYVST